MNCHICAEASLREIRDYHSLSRSASDCSPWQAGGRIGVCKNCGLVQKILDEAWYADISQIYAKYDIYHQSPTHREQPIFIASKNSWIPRSEVMLEYFLEYVPPLPMGKKIMDIGCGNGATLRAMAKMFPGCDRYGFDPTATNIKALQARDDLGLTACSNSLDELPKRYDLLTMVHVLEHIPNALTVIKEYVRMLSDDGYFVIVVPNFLENPFDITIADHCSHFCPATLQNLLRSAGLEICKLSATVIPKELIVIGKKSIVVESKIDTNLVSNNFINLQAQVQWLHNINNQVADIIKKPGRFGVFGTSIAGNWMYGSWMEHIKFFVDEDPDRIGTIYRGVPIVSMDQLTEKDIVYIALPHQVAAKIQLRYRNAACQIFITPEVIVNHADVGAFA